MPDTLRKDLIDLAWSTIGDYFADRPALLARLGVDNRSRETETGYLKGFLQESGAPADQAHAKCVVERMTSTGWTRSGSLCADRRTDYIDGTDEFPVIRTARLVFTLYAPLPNEAATGEDEEDEQNLGDEIVNALYAAGPSLGTNYIVSTGEPSVEERDTRTDEKPQPGKVYTVTFEITAQQMGRALLTSINDI